MLWGEAYEIVVDSPCALFPRNKLPGKFKAQRCTRPRMGERDAIIIVIIAVINEANFGMNLGQQSR